jgi:hypothetical protein
MVTTKRQVLVHRRIGDNHLTNCNLCGAFLPKSGCSVVRDKKRQGQLSKINSSDILRALYSLCHAKSQNQNEQLKLSQAYTEVRHLIVDWLYEVTENLKLQQRSLYHAVSILD